MIQSAPVSTNPATPILNCLMLELSERILLVPNVAVAEVINMREATPRAGMPAWYMGEIEWRDLQVPLICFENISSGSPVPDYEKGRIVVLNAMSGVPDFHFFALLLKNIPSPLKVDPQGLKSAGEALAEYELDSVFIGEDLYKLPDLLAVEKKLEDIGLI